MSVTKNFSWALSGSGWSINYTATVTISVTRAYGSDIATVKAVGSMTTPVGNGDGNAAWKFWIKIGNSSYTKTISSGYHAPGRTDSFTYTWDISVGANSGTLSGKVDFQAYDNNNGFGSWAGEQSWSQDYGNKGASTIASATNVSLNTSGTATSTVTFTSYSSSFNYDVWAKIGSTTTSTVNVSGVNNATKTATLTFGTAFINAISSGTSANATVYLKTKSNSTQIGDIASKQITVTVPSSGINPTVTNINFAKVSALSSTYFSGKLCTLIDKVQVGWTEGLPYGSSVSSRTVSVNGQTLAPSTNSVTSTSALANYGSQTATVSIKDARGNSSGNVASSTFYVYRYFYPDVKIRYEHSGSYYKLYITGSIAYVGGDNSKSLTLNIYKGEGETPTGTHTLTSSISAQTGNTYEAYYPINIEYNIDTTEITDIAIDTYRFEVTAQDSVATITSKTYSGISVISLNAGGTGITMYKPVTIEDKTYINRQLYMRNDTVDGGGAVRFIPQNDDGSHTMYIDTYQGNLRIGSTEKGGSIAKFRPSGKTEFVDNIIMYAGSYTSNNNLNNLNPDETSFCWCNNVQNKPTGSGQYGRLIALPYIQIYTEFLGQATSPNRVWFRMHANSAWTTWQMFPSFITGRKQRTVTKSLSLSANGYGWAEIAPTSGDTVVSLDGYYLTGSGNTNCTIYACYYDASANKFQLAARTWSSSAITVTAVWRYTYT